MSSSEHWNGTSMGLPVFSITGGRVTAGAMGAGTTGGVGGWSCANASNAAKAPSRTDLKGLMALKGQPKMALSLNQNKTETSNIHCGLYRLLGKSPLRQRAHSPLSPKCAR